MLPMQWPFHTNRTGTPFGLRWRSSLWFITLVVGLGIFTDVFFYTIIIPVVPFRLQELGYKNPSSLTGWLLFAFSGSFVLSTPPVAWLSERYKTKRAPLLTGLAGLFVAQIMFMLAPAYWLMVIARIFQGLSSTIVWTVGLALLSDTCPESKIGEQIGVAISGISIASISAPPIGGSLYDKFGFHAPFILSIGVLMLDVLGRLLIIEKKDALKWDVPSSAQHDENGQNILSNNGNNLQAVREQTERISMTTAQPNDNFEKEEVKETSQPSASPLVISSEEGALPLHTLSTGQILRALLCSRRMLSATITAVVYGIAYTAQEPTLPLRFQQMYGQTPRKVGLLYLPIVLPTIFSGYIGGKMADRFGSGIVCAMFFALCMPWMLVMVIQSPLPAFVLFAVFTNFCLSGSIAPITAELAAVGRLTAGVGYNHVYGGFNMAYGFGSAVGPLIAGQLYDHLQHGWAVVMSFCAGISLLAAAICFFTMDAVPPWIRLNRWIHKRICRKKQINNAPHARSDTAVTP